MNITTERDQEVWHDLQEAGAYEWWYFDAEDKTSGFSFEEKIFICILCLKFKDR